MAKKSIHPFKQIHPWRSEKEFADDLLNNIIYDKDGLVVLNKPYGIPRGKGSSEFNRTNSVSHSVHYTLEDALPHIRSQLKYPQLTISKCPEKCCICSLLPFWEHLLGDHCWSSNYTGKQLPLSAKNNIRSSV
ncbi:hypothetical protein ANTRET_LOCUS8120 [Anthophora retusa]